MTQSRSSRWAVRRMVSLVAIALALLIGLGVAAWYVSAENASQGTERQEVIPLSLERAHVVRVVDGDTLVVELADGAREKVRLIGINAPESVAADTRRNTAEGAKSSQFLKDLLSEGEAVWLEADVSDRDQYDRLLRYVWLEVASEHPDQEEVAERMLNGLLVDRGYAQARRYKPDTSYSAVLESLGKEASNEGRGVSDAWAQD